MARVYAVDVYGTLIDPIGIAVRLEDLVGGRAAEFARRWRDKQLEYTFRRALMRQYTDFRCCTREALRYVDAQLATGLSAGDYDALMSAYRELPAYPEVREALERLRSQGHRMFAFSNGHPADLEALLAHAGLLDSLDGIVSVHPVRSFKPDPAVYRHFLDVTGAPAADIWLVSGNPFDIIGAAACGWKTAWVIRDPAAVFDPWGIEPTATVEGLAPLADQLNASD